MPGDDRPEVRTRPAWLLAARAVVLPWLVSRLLSVVALLAWMPGDAGFRVRLTDLIYAWDGNHYFAIARTGYGLLGAGQPLWAFFPGFPGVIRGLGQFTDDEIGTFVVNQLAFLVALAGLYVLARRHVSPRAAELAVWALALFPASFVFSMSYPSALFLATMVWAFVLVEDRRDLAASALAVGATMLRPNGFVVVLALALAAWSIRRIVVLALPSLLAFLAWCWYCREETGNALAFVYAKTRWDEITLVGLFSHEGNLSALPHALLAVAALVAVLWQRKRLPFAWVVLTVLLLVPSLITGMVGLGRYANEAFPVFVAAGLILDRWGKRLAVPAFALSLVGFTAMTWAVMREGLVP